MKPYIVGEIDHSEATCICMLKMSLEALNEICESLDEVFQKCYQDTVG